MEYENQMTVGNADHDAEMPQEWLDKALDDVVETVLQDFQYPARRRDGTTPRVQFDLIEFVQDEFDSGDVVRDYLTMLTDFSSDSDLLRLRASENLETALRVHFTDSQIVADRAAEMEREDEADHV